MLGKMKLGFESNGFSFPLKVNLTLREKLLDLRKDKNLTQGTEVLSDSPCH